MNLSFYFLQIQARKLFHKYIPDPVTSAFALQILYSHAEKILSHAHIVKMQKYFLLNIVNRRPFDHAIID